MLTKPLIEAFKNNAKTANSYVDICDSSGKPNKKLKNFDPQKICYSESGFRKTLKSGNIDFPNCDETPENVDLGITGCEFLVAQPGSTLVSPEQKGGHQLFIFP